MSDIIELKAVDSGNWRDVAGLEVAESQKDIVQQSSYYLALCHYGKQWKPLAVELDGKVIGFMMWAVDDDDGSCWLGGIIIDLKLQGQGYGHRAVKSAVTMLSG
ncbi:MAG: GNAT family N-acetyltransferase, partial [Spirochaetaceae bacterium]|nr:GNAT family N-acetyltransferase [Spirochaetaceae bacterium]